MLITISQHVLILLNLIKTYLTVVVPNLELHKWKWGNWLFHWNSEEKERKKVIWLPAKFVGLLTWNEKSLIFMIVSDN